MSTELIAKKTIEMEDSIISKISYTDLAVYKFIQEQFENSDVSQNLIFQYVYCKYYTLDLQKVDDLFIKGYFELMQSLKGTKNIDMESLLFKVYSIKTNRELKFHYSFTSKLAHTIDNNIPIWDSRIAKVFNLNLTSVKDNGVNGDNFCNVIEILQNKYNKLISENMICSTISKFDSKFGEFKISDVKKIDFLFWSLGKL